MTTDPNAAAASAREQEEGASEASPADRGNLPAYRQDRARQRLSTVNQDGDAGVRAQAVHVRNQEQCSAMGWKKRTKLRFRRLLCCGRDELIEGVGGGAGPQDPEAPSAPAKVQYRLEARRERRGNIFSMCVDLLFCGSGSMSNSTGLGITNPNQLLAMYLHWMFRVNFFFLFTVSCIFFFVFTILFAGFITWAGRLDATCVVVGGEPFASADNPFADAFALSWTTFSTVGYGSTYPALSNQQDNPNNCTFITLICSLESFLGVLYSGFCGAILFGKVLRIQSHAQVIFSDPIVIRYGSGVENFDDGADDDEDDEEEEPEEETAKEESNEESTSGGGGGGGGVSFAATTKAGNAKKRKKKKIPCPVLEFRVVNRLFNEEGGEIMDAMLNVVANVDADDVDPTLRDAVDAERRRWLQQQQSSMLTTDPETATEGSESESERTTATDISNVPTASIATVASSTGATIKGGLAKSGVSLRKLIDPLGLVAQATRDHQAVDEDPSSKLVNKRIFSKLLIEASDHPFFKRVWLARHILDETSPILTPKARRQIRRNGGYWPESLNHHDAVRNSIQFNQILVSLTGVSNVSASDVYAQKIYDFVDINVGYQFVNILYRDGDVKDGVLKVDKDLINDVREQNGGGGEPLVM